MRFVRARYFSSHAQFVKAQAEPNKFNVERKLYEDENKAFWDRDPKPKRPGNDSGMAANASKKQAGSNLRSDEESQVEKWLMQVASCGSQEPDVPEPIDGKVGTIRTRATFWRSKGENGKPDIGRNSWDFVEFVRHLTNRCPGVLLLDPTIKGGFQLWRGHKNWARVPKMRAEVPNAADTSNGSRGQGAEPPNAPDTGNGLLGTEAEARNVPGERNGSRDGEDKAHKAPVARKGRREELSFFEDYIRWAKEPGVVLLKQSGTMCTTDWPHDMTPMLALLRLVCAEWLVISQYIKTRLSQVPY